VTEQRLLNVSPLYLFLPFWLLIQLSDDLVSIGRIVWKIDQRIWPIKELFKLAVSWALTQQDISRSGTLEISVSDFNLISTHIGAID